MRSRLVTVLMLAVLIAGTSANAQPKGQRATIKGELWICGATWRAAIGSSEEGLRHSLRQGW
jgi:hypothetical protein